METLGRVGEALADPVRRAVLARLTEGPGYPAELADEVGVSRSSSTTSTVHCPIASGADRRRVAVPILDTEAVSALARPRQNAERHQRVRAAMRSAHRRKAPVRIPSAMLVELYRGLGTDVPIDAHLGRGFAQVVTTGARIARIAGHLLARRRRRQRAGHRRARRGHRDPGSGTGAAAARERSAPAKPGLNTDTVALGALFVAMFAFLAAVVAIGLASRSIDEHRAVRAGAVPAASGASSPMVSLSEFSISPDPVEVAAGGSLSVSC